MIATASLAGFAELVVFDCGDEGFEE